MRPDINWTENYIEEFLPQIEEQDWLECKSGRILEFENDKKQKEINIAREISAILNAGGGYIVFGVDDKSKQVDDGGVSKTIKNNTKEWLENILPSLVDPPLKKFNILKIDRKENGNSKISEGKAVYVLDIAESEQAPHQSSKENIYYLRSGSHTFAASHQVVLDILGRQKYPKIEISFNYATVNGDQPNRHILGGQHPILIVSAKNVGKVLAKYVNVIINIQPYLIPGQNINELGEIEKISGKEYLRIVRENVITEIYGMDGRIIAREPGRYTPLLPNREHAYAIPLCHDFETKKLYFKKNEPVIKWELYADNAPGASGEIAMAKIKNDKRLPDS